jgi:hypothetical protein
MDTRTQDSFRCVVRREQWILLDTAVMPISVRRAGFRFCSGLPVWRQRSGWKTDAWRPAEADTSRCMESAFSPDVRRYRDCWESDAVSKNYCLAESRGLFMP